MTRSTKFQYKYELIIMSDDLSHTSPSTTLDHAIKNAMKSDDAIEWCKNHLDINDWDSSLLKTPQYNCHRLVQEFRFKNEGDYLLFILGWA